MKIWLKLLIVVIVCVVISSPARAYDLRTRSSRILVHQAKDAYAQGNTAQAMANYQQALARCPDNVEALNGLAVAEEQIGASDKARSHWGKAIALNPGFWEAYNHLGDLYVKQQNFAKAVEYYEQCAAKAPFGHPEGIKARQGLDGIAGRSPYYKDKLVRSQAQEMEEELNQRKAEALYNQVNLAKSKLQEGKQFLQQGHYQDAIVAFNAVLRLAPGHPEAKRLRQAAVLALRKETNNALTDAAIEGLIHQ